MRILHIINSLDIGGAERLVVDLLPFINSENIPCDLLLLNSKETPLSRELIRSKKCKIFYLNAIKIYNPFLILKIIPYLKRYDIVHIHLIPSLYWVSFAKIISRAKAKLIYTEHTVIIKKRSQWFFRKIDQFIYKKLDRVICISQPVETSLKIHLNNNPTNISIIANGIPLAKFTNALPKSREELGLVPSDFIAVQVSSFRPAKDQKTVLEAAKSFPDDIKLIFVGDGQNKNDCEEYALKMGFGHKILFLGNCGDIPSLLSMADVVVLSSHYEAFGLAALEGMASKKPVVATNVPGLAELVEDAGILFDQGDAQALASVILSLKNDKKYYNNVANRSYVRSLEFSIDNMARNYIDLYRSILKKD